MNSSVDRADLGDSSYAGVKYVVVSGNQLTCIQRICSLATRDNHLHGLTSSKNDVIRIEDVRIRINSSGTVSIVVKSNEKWLLKAPAPSTW